MPAIVSVTCYFEKYRSVATGIGVCGSGFGTMIFAPLMRQCLSTFKLEGTYLVLAGVVLTCVFYGILLRPVPSVETTPPEIMNNIYHSPENVPLTVISPAEDGEQDSITKSFILLLEGKFRLSTCHTEIISPSGKIMEKIL